VAQREAPSRRRWLETTIIERDSEKGREMAGYFLEKRGIVTALLDQDRMI
jgi:hypothetical protein